MLENDFIENGTEYVKYEIKDSNEANRIKEKTGQNTFPILFIDNKLVGGYNEYRTLVITNQFACDF
jgi:glutaredoxin